MIWVLGRRCQIVPTAHSLAPLGGGKRLIEELLRHLLGIEIEVGFADKVVAVFAFTVGLGLAHDDEARI